MSKYYKAEDVIRKRAEDLADTSYWEYGNPKNVDDWLEVAEMEFADLPTIEVVFCEECKYAPYCEQRLVKGLFGNEIAEWQEIDFCQHGERIDNE